MFSEQYLAWTKRVEAQRAQPAIFNSLGETKDYDTIRTVGGEHRKM